MKNLEILKVWSNSELRQKQERQNLEIQEMTKLTDRLQKGVLSLKTDLQDAQAKNLELLNSNNTYQAEIKNLQGSNKNLTDKCKKELNGLRNKLKESQDVNFIKTMVLMMLAIVLLITGLWIWKLKSDNKMLVLNNNEMQEYIKQNLSGERQRSH